MAEVSRISTLQTIPTLMQCPKPTFISAQLYFEAKPQFNGVSSENNIFSQNYHSFPILLLESSFRIIRQIESKRYKTMYKSFHNLQKKKISYHKSIKRSINIFFNKSQNALIIPIILSGFFLHNLFI